MKIIKNYIVVKKFINVPDDKNYESKSYELGIMGDCFDTYAEAKEYAMSLREKHKEVSFGEVFYTDSQVLTEGEKPNIKYFLVIKEIDTVVCRIDTTDNCFLAHINNFYDNNMSETANQRTLTSFLKNNNYINVRGIESERDFIINTAQITSIRL